MSTEDLSKRNIRKNCPHCDPNSFALKHPLLKTSQFWIVCDVYPSKRSEKSENGRQRPEDRKQKMKKSSES